MEESIETNPEPASPTAERLCEVLRLTATLSDRVLDAQIMKRPVPDDQVRALTAAAELSRGDDLKATGLNRFLRAFRKSKDGAA